MKFQRVVFIVRFRAAVTLQRFFLRKLNAKPGKMIIDLDVGIDIRLLDRIDRDIRKRLLAVDVADHKAVYLLMQRLAHKSAGVLLEHRRLIALERRARTVSLRDGREIRAAIEPGDRAVGPVDERRVWDVRRARRADKLNLRFRVRLNPAVAPDRAERRLEIVPLIAPERRCSRSVDNRHSAAL